MGLEVFDGLVSAVETISATIAVPVGAFEPFLPFNGANYFTMVATSKHLKAWRLEGTG